MTSQEKQALAEAKEQGYFVQSLGITKKAVDAWLRWCTEQKSAFIVIKGHGKFRKVELEMRSVYPLRLSVLPDFHTRIEALRRYDPMLGYAYDIVTLQVQQERVHACAKELKAIWEEAKRIQESH